VLRGDSRLQDTTISSASSTNTGRTCLVA
jgi:hypothetical protein